MGRSSQPALPFLVSQEVVPIMGLFSFLFGARPDAEMAKLYGSGHLFTEGADIFDSVASSGGSNALLFGTNGFDAARGAIWLPAQSQGHTWAIGAARSGKFVGLVAPALLSYCGSIVMLDPKGEGAWASADRRRAMGQRVVILDPWQEVNRRYGDHVGIREHVSTFNPLAHIRPNDPDFGDEINALADAVVVTHGNETQPHFPESARELVAGIIAASVERAPGVASFDDVRRLLTVSDHQLATVIRKITEQNPRSLGARKLARFTTPGSNELSSIRSTAATQTAMLDTVRLLTSMETGPDAFDMSDIARGRVTLFLVLPMDKLETYGRWLRLVLTLAIRAVARSPLPVDPPILFLLDELATVGKFPAVENAVALLAGQGLRFFGLYQNLGQLKRDYPANWQTFIANASNLLGLGVNDDETAEFFSEFMGTRTIPRLETSRSGGPGGPSFSQQWQYSERRLMLRNEVKEKDPSTLLVLRQGGPYLHLTKPVYHRERIWRGLYRPNPHFMSVAERDMWANHNRPLSPPSPPPRPTAPPPRVEARPATTVVRCGNCRQALRLPLNREGWATCPACRNRWKLASDG